jgi:MFS transporter, AAHS family, 4-hydroxybenzoate transporter
LSALRIRVAVLCGLVIFADGLDVQVISYLAPYISSDWSLPKGALGMTFSAGLLGLMGGAMVVAPLADRYGRRSIILVSTVIFGVFTLASAFATGLSQLLLLRLLTGVGLGGALVNAIALTSEYSSARHRVSMVMIVTLGMSVGSIAGGVLVAALAPRFGWQFIFLAAGVLALALLPVLFFFLPESERFLTLRRETSLEEPDADERRARVAQLFAVSRRRFTLLLWMAMFLTLLNLYLIVNWLPTALHAEGLSPESAALVATCFHVGGILGTPLMAFVGDRIGPRPVLLTGYVLASACLVLLATHPASALPWTALILVGVGAGTIGGQIGMIAICTVIYSTAIRSTGTGWALGVGRVGSIVGPAVGGAVLSSSTNTSMLFVLCVGPALGAAAAVAFLRVGRGSERPAGPA